MSRRGQAAPAAGPPRILAVHRYAFVQHLMHHNCLSEAAVKDAFAKLTGSTEDGALWGMIADQNKEMESLHWQIKRMRYLVDNSTYYGFINTLPDAPSKVGSRYNFHQRDFFRQVLEAIAQDESAQDGVGALPEMQLLNMHLRPAAVPTQAADGSQLTAGKPLSKQERVETLHNLVADKWLAYSEAKPHHYCFGLRSFLELSDMLLAMDVPEATRKAWLDVM